MKVLIVGASGIVGREVFEKVSERHETIGTHFGMPAEEMIELDITKKPDVEKFFEKHKPEAIVHMAAVTDVDLCEKKPELAENVHVNGTKNLVDWAKKNHVYFIYFSTDFVFDGEKGNYSEDDETKPVNVYGKTKLQGEEIVKELENYLVFRISTPYSKDLKTKKFVGAAIEKLRRGEEVTGFEDLKRSPTFVSDVAENIVTLLEKQEKGVLHAAGSSQITMYEAAEIIAKVFGYDEDIVKKGKSTSVNFPAKRPLDTTLNVEKARKLGLRLRTFEEGIEEIKKIL